MNEKEKRAAQAEARVKRWNESVARVQALCAEWQSKELIRLPNKVLLYPIKKKA